MTLRRGISATHASWLKVGIAAILMLGVTAQAMAQSRMPTSRAGLEAAADTGNAEAQFRLGQQLRHSRDSSGGDLARAVDLFGRAAAQGHPGAQTELGDMYLNGIGLRPDPGQAFRLFRLAADKGESAAEYNLGWMLHHGAGVPKNPREAAYWYRRAAKKGHPQAQHNLGVMYAQGYGVPQNSAEARRLIRSAAEAGDVNAMFNLGQLFEAGASSHSQRMQAATWFSLAARRGHARAQGKADAMMERLNTAQYGRTRDMIETMDRRIRDTGPPRVVAGLPPGPTTPPTTTAPPPGTTPGATDTPSPLTPPTPDTPPRTSPAPETEPETAAVETPRNPAPVAREPTPPAPDIIYARIPMPSEE